MWTTILTALINLLVSLFEQWWANRHPVNPAPTKDAYLQQVSKWRYFWMGPKRLEWAAKLHDKATAAYTANPPLMELSDAPLSEQHAHELARAYCGGLEL